MTYRSPAWQTLGIEPTEDRRAIRVAYARRLKEIDVDADPQAFIALREALESAQQEAEWAEMDRQWAAREAEEDEPDDGATTDPDDIAAELARQKLTVGYHELPPTPDRHTAPSDPRWAQAEAPPASEAPEQTHPVPERDRWETPELPAEPELVETAEADMSPADDRWEAREAPAEPEAPPRPNPWGPAQPADVDAHAQALLGLLRELHETDGASPDHWEARMLEHWNAIVGDPRMQEIGHYADAERWWSDVIAQSVPWSDPLVRPAAALFGWLAQADEVSQAPAAAHIVRRLYSLEFFRAVQQRKHPLNAAWRELVKPASEGSRRGWVNSAQVRELLATVREHYPDLEACFDWYRVGMWEDQVTSRGGGGGFPVWAWIVVVIFAIRLLGSLGGMDKPSTAVPPIAPTIERSAGGDQTATLPYFEPETPLTKPVPDIDRVLQDKFGEDIDVASIQIENPALFAKLEQQWNASNDAGASRERFTREVSGLADRWYQNGVRTGNIGLLTDYQRLSIDMAKALHAKGAGKCARFLKGNRRWDGELGLDDALRERERKLMARTLLETKGVWRDQPSANVSGEIIARAARRAKVSEQAVGNWIEGKGGAADNCDMSIAIFEVVLEQPAKVRLPILRVL